MEDNVGAAMQFLQSKALCIMPISLASAIYQTQPPDTSSIVKPENNPPSQTLGKRLYFSTVPSETHYMLLDPTPYISFSNPTNLVVPSVQIAIKVRCHNSCFSPFLLAFVKTGIDVNALKNASRPFMSCQVPSKGEELSKLT